MSRMKSLGLVVAVAVVGATACNESTGPSDGNLSSAFISAPAGFNEVSNSFGSFDASAGQPWRPEHGRGGPGGNGGGPGMRDFMGPGMGAAFIGGVPFGRGPDRGPFAMGDDSNCAFSAATGDITCSAVTRNGLTITRILTYKTAIGTTQSARDSTTNSARIRMTANGTVTRQDGNVTATVDNRSDRTVTGLAYNSTQRLVNGTAAGSESASGTTRDGTAFTSTRTMSESIVGLTIPLEAGRPTYPTAGTVSRNMNVTMTSGDATRTSVRSEVITYNGSATATLTITHDGNTKTCSLPLPHGRPSCQ